MTGKLDPAALAPLLTATGVDDPAVLQGAAYGEDAAAIDVRDDRTLVISTDPLSLAAEAVGRLAVHVTCNDVAASGGDPRWLTNTVLLPDDDPDQLSTIASQVDDAARSVGVAIIGGHTEVVPALARPLLSMTAIGPTDRFVPSGGATPGETLICAGSAGIEATGILATDFRARCLDAGVEPAVLDAAAAFLDEISVISAARTIRDVASALHDPTEGGSYTGLVEMATASNCVFKVEREAVPIRSETAACCAAVDVDPLATFGSGALLAAVPNGSVDDAMAALTAAEIESAIIGQVTTPTSGRTGGTVVLDGTPMTEPPRDELYPLWE